MIVEAGKDYDGRKLVDTDRRVQACRDNIFALIQPGDVKVDFSDEMAEPPQTPM